MKRFTLLVILLVAATVLADFTENIIVTEEVEVPASAPIVEDALNVMTDQLQNNDVPEPTLTPVPTPELTPLPSPEPISVAVPVPFGPSDEPVPTPEPELVTVVEEVISPAQAPYIEEALEVMIERLESNETNESVVERLEVYDAEGNELRVIVDADGDDVVVDFVEGPIASMELYNTENIAALPRVDEVPTTIPAPVAGQEWARIYAIDPTNTTFDSGIVEVVAKGTSLYKCEEWDFDNRVCNGTWQLIADDMVPGNTYYLEINPADPAFGELSEGNGTFFEDWESNDLSTNGWYSTGIWATENSTVYAGNYSIAAKNTVGVEKTLSINISTANYQNVTFSFVTQTQNMDVGEYIAADWYNGTAWTTMLSAQTITNWTTYSYSLNSTAAHNSAFAIRFRCINNAASEKCRLDNIEVSGGDVTPPTIGFISPTPANDTLTDEATLTINVSHVEANPDSISLYVDSVLNETKTYSGNFTNFTIILADGIHNYNITLNDTDGNSASTETRYVTIDTSASIYDSVVETPADPATYAFNQTYMFEINWSDGGIIDSVVLEFEGVNYTDIAQDGDTFSKNITDLAAGTYSYIWYANDTFGHENNTGSLTYTIEKAASEVNLTLDGIDDGVTIAAPGTVNITGSLIEGENGFVQLFRDGIEILNGTSPISINESFAGLGTFNVTLLYLETENYSSSSETHLVTVLDYDDPMITINSPVNNTNITVSTYNFNFTATDLFDSVLNCTLKVNGTGVATNESTLNNTPTILSASLVEGQNTWSVSCMDSSSNTDEIDEFVINVDLPSPSGGGGGGGGGGGSAGSSSASSASSSSASTGSGTSSGSASSTGASTSSGSGLAETEEANEVVEEIVQQESFNKLTGFASTEVEIEPSPVLEKIAELLSSIDFIKVFAALAIFGISALVVLGSMKKKGGPEEI